MTRGPSRTARLTCYHRSFERQAAFSLCRWSKGCAQSSFKHRALSRKASGVMQYCSSDKLRPRPTSGKKSFSQRRKDQRKGRKEAGRKKGDSPSLLRRRAYCCGSAGRGSMRRLGGSLHPAILFLAKLLRRLCAALRVFARDSSFPCRKHTITPPLKEEAGTRSIPALALRSMAFGDGG